MTKYLECLLEMTTDGLAGPDRPHGTFKDFQRSDTRQTAQEEHAELLAMQAQQHDEDVAGRGVAVVNSIYGCLQPGMVADKEHVRMLFSTGARLELFVALKPEYVFADDTKGVVEDRAGKEVTLMGWSVPASDFSRKLKHLMEPATNVQRAGADAANSWDRPPRGMSLWEALTTSTTINSRVSVFQEVLSILKARTGCKSVSQLRAKHYLPKVFLIAAWLE